MNIIAFLLRIFKFTNAAHSTNKTTGTDVCIYKECVLFTLSTFHVHVQHQLHAKKGQILEFHGKCRHEKDATVRIFNFVQQEICDPIGDKRCNNYSFREYCRYLNIYLVIYRDNFIRDTECQVTPEFDLVGHIIKHFNDSFTHVIADLKERIRHDTGSYMGVTGLGKYEEIEGYFKESDAYLISNTVKKSGKTPVNIGRYHQKKLFEFVKMLSAGYKNDSPSDNYHMIDNEINLFIFEQLLNLIKASQGSSDNQFSKSSMLHCLEVIKSNTEAVCNGLRQKMVFLNEEYLTKLLKSVPRNNEDDSKIIVSYEIEAEPEKILITPRTLLKCMMYAAEMPYDNEFMDKIEYCEFMLRRVLLEIYNLIIGNSHRMHLKGNNDN